MGEILVPTPSHIGGGGQLLCPLLLEVVVDFYFLERALGYPNTLSPDATVHVRDAVFSHLTQKSEWSLLTYIFSD